MLSHGWQIGLHITNENISVAAVQYQRRRWVLQRWWLFPLRKPVFTPTGSMDDPCQLKEVLSTLQACLPRKYSLRVSYPVQCALLRTLPLPATSMTAYYLERYVSLSIKKLFPNLNELCCDYRAGPDVSKELSVVVTRAQLLNSYCALFYAAGLSLDIVELGSSSLQPLITHLTDSCLLVEDGEYWLWAANRGAQWRHGWLLRSSYPQVTSLPEVITPQYQHYFFAGNESHRGSVLLQSFSPFDLLSNSYPPHPSVPHLLTVALGLALRQEDKL